MPKTIWILLLLLVGCGAQEPVREKTDAPKPIFLWEAKHETGTAYLFGTIHLPDPRVLALPRAVDEAFTASDIVLTELELTPAAQVKMLQMMMLPKGESLTKLLPKETQARLAKRGLPMAAVDKYKVWGLMASLIMLHGREYFGGGRQAIDAVLPARAKREGKQVGALEIPEEQIGVFEKLTTEEQIRMLDDTLTLIEKDVEAGTNSLGEMLDLYLAGDLDAMVNFQALNGRDPTEADKKFMKWILDDRNVHMADRLADRMKKAPGKVWFVAVGAAHYAGPMGVNKLLAKKGFKVRRMTRDDKIKKREPEAAGAK